jgi:3',5'-cyclic AMP phosphodiesterase CpdA
VRTLQPAVDVLLLTGDLADSGRPQDYAEIAALLADTLPTPSEGGPRVLAVPGNHDLRAHARQAWQQPCRWRPMRPATASACTSSTAACT